MRKLTFIWILVVPLSGGASFGWSFKDYSFLAGKQFRFGQRSLWNLEFQFDKFSSGCLHRTHYMGIGVNYSFNDEQKEYGIKVMWNPTRYVVMINRVTKFYPYLFGQTNLVQTESFDPITGDKPINRFGFRPGVGLAGNIREDKELNIRTTLQVGFNLPHNSTQLAKNSLTVELKIGVGLNSKRLKRNRQSEKEIEQQENQ